MIDKYVFTRLSSEKSFRDAIGKTSVEAGYMIDALDNMHASISNYESGIHNISAETQAFYALLCKRTNDSYTGIIMSYYVYNPIFFAANYKGFILFVPIKANINCD